MQDQFSPGAIKVLIQAQQEAKTLRQPEVDTGEILVAIFADENSAAVQSL